MSVLFFKIVSISLLYTCNPAKESEGPYFGNGVHNSWADQTSVSIWTRLTKNPEMNQDGQKFMELTKQEADSLARFQDVEMLHRHQIPEGLTLDDMEGACPGAMGEVSLTYFKLGSPEESFELDWVAVDHDKNYTSQWRIENLTPGTHYIIRLKARPMGSRTITDEIEGAFFTPPDENSKKEISFCVVSCHDYNRRDSISGHKIYSSMEKDSLDFYVHTGDVEYYDKPQPWAMTEPMMRFKWDRLFALPLQRKFWMKTTTYFMKDDHDVVRNDSYPGQTYGPVTFERGLDIFDKEQFPSNDKPYKTVRWGRDLQIWILEGRNYRSKNTDEDGPGKTILGQEQKDWLFSTLKESDATYKVIITSSPILGPDRPRGKNDNYSNKAFEYEGTEIRNFLNQFDNVYVCTGDRHWQYVSHFEGSNLWEFGCGAGSDEHAGGWREGDMKPEHRFLRVKGGYLYGNVYYENKHPILRFEHRDVNGERVHEEVFE